VSEGVAGRGRTTAILRDPWAEPQPVSGRAPRGGIVQAMTSALHQPITIGGVTIRNRLYRAPVLEGAGSGPDAGVIYKDAFEENARAGVGLIIQGNSCITEEGRSSPGMTMVDTRERALGMSEMTKAVHAHGGRVFLQIGHAGIYAMEGWHKTYADARKAPLIAVSKPPVHVRPALRGVPIHVLETSEIRDLAEAFGRSAAWAREAGYDGVQIASSNAKLIHQFISPYYNRRGDEFGGSTRNRARILELLADRIREHAGTDFPLTVKIPMGEDSPPLSPAIGHDEGIELCRLAEQFGYHAITPVGLSVFPHGSLCRGGYPSSIDDTASIQKRYEEALGGSNFKMRVLRWGYKRGAKQYPFMPLWNRPFFTAAKRAVQVPIFAVGGIRALDECEEILGAGDADMIGIGRPFYAEPELPARLLAGDRGETLCESSNRCLPPQMLGMKAACYNPNVQRKRAAMRAAARE
jgi:2,4-dienoyl-CoA reductase-like NADH-dependent reductase (Old Yellow Enzyme family)